MSEAPSSETPATLGPVQQLAPHVPDDWWRTLFGATYLKTDADVLDAENTQAEIDRVVELLHLQKDARILDLCCGQGRHALELARRGFSEVEGLDQSAFLIDRARERGGEEGLEVPFRTGDSRRLPYADGSFGAVLIMGNSFGYFSREKEDRIVLEEVRRVLTSGGQLLLDVTDGTFMRSRFEPRSWEWIDADHIACRERELSEDGRRLISREVVLHVQDGVLADQFYAERLYSRSELCTLLQEVGFHQVRASDDLQTRSSRGQDLGMMGRRCMVTAVADGSGRQPVVRCRRVAVVLGDPRLPDETKLEGRFGEADARVVRRLKKALDEIDGFDFTYLDNHDTLEEDLRLLQADVDFVFNLCDEGLYNHPRQEMHVPVLLELLGLAYTGGTPRCLACCYDKSLVRGVARELDIPVASGYMLEPGAALPNALPFDFPIIVKPNATDSSIGITKDSVARDWSSLKRAVASVRQVVGCAQPLVIEQFLQGADMTVSLIGNGDDIDALPITQEDYSHLPRDLPPLCGFEAKFLSDSPYYMQEERTVLINLPGETQNHILTSCRRLFKRLECRDYARFDWRLDAEGRPHLLEVNPNPGWCWDGHLALQAKKRGWSYPELLGRLLQTAECRIRAAL